jgi:hypothetical protein
VPTAQAAGTAKAEAARKPRLETRRDEGEGGRCGNVDIPSAGRQPAQWPVPKRIIYYIDRFSREWATATSAASASVAAGTLTAPTPTITRAVTAGDTLTAHAGNRGPSGVTLKYQWYASGQAINGRWAAR